MGRGYLKFGNRRQVARGMPTTGHRRTDNRKTSAAPPSIRYDELYREQLEHTQDPNAGNSRVAISSAEVSRPIGDFAQFIIIFIHHPELTTT